MAKKKITSAVKALNAPKKLTWIIALCAALLGLILWIVGLCAKINVLGIIGPILQIVSSGLLLLSSYVKNL